MAHRQSGWGHNAPVLAATPHQAICGLTRAGLAANGVQERRGFDFLEDERPSSLELWENRNWQLTARRLGGACSSRNLVQKHDLQALRPPASIAGRFSFVEPWPISNHSGMTSVHGALTIDEEKGRFGGEDGQPPEVGPRRGEAASGAAQD